MKQKLLDWGFTSTVKMFDEGLEALEKSNTIVTVKVTLMNGKMNIVELDIRGNKTTIPNITGELSLFTQLYYLGLVEVQA